MQRLPICTIYKTDIWANIFLGKILLWEIGRFENLHLVKYF